jgi:nucleoid-associated protein YgaU
LRLIGNFIATLLFFTLAACATQPPRFRNEAVSTLEWVRREGGEKLHPAEYGSTLEAFQKGEALLKEGEPEDAERYFSLTMWKGALLERELQEEKARQKEAARLAEERKKAELERRALEEANRLAQAKAEALAQKEAAEAERRKKAKPPKEKEYVLVFSYTVRRGESLPFIASQPQVYADRNLWPLIYRANRDQISDPRHIWPGQVLRVPRNLGRDDIAEARRYAQERPLH